MAIVMIDTDSREMHGERDLLAEELIQVAISLLEEMNAAIKAGLVELGLLVAARDGRLAEELAMLVQVADELAYQSDL